MAEKCDRCGKPTFGNDYNHQLAQNVHDMGFGVIENTFEYLCSECCNELTEVARAVRKHLSELKGQSS